MSMSSSPAVGIARGTRTEIGPWMQSDWENSLWRENWLLINWSVILWRDFSLCRLKSNVDPSFYHFTLCFQRSLKSKLYVCVYSSYYNKIYKNRLKFISWRFIIKYIQPIRSISLWFIQKYRKLNILSFFFKKIMMKNNEIEMMKSIEQAISCMFTNMIDDMNW